MQAWTSLRIRTLLADCKMPPGAHTSKPDCHRFCTQDIVFSASDSEMEDVESSEEEDAEMVADPDDPLRLTASETAAAANVPLHKVLHFWAQNEVRMDADDWMPQRNSEPGTHESELPWLSRPRITVIDVSMH